MKELGRIIKLHTISDPRGNLTVSEENIELPFDLKRAYWIYDVPQGGNRGSHAHKSSSKSSSPCMDHLPYP